MWCVRCGYRMSDGSISYDYKICESRDIAIRFASSRRACLNSHWTVEVLRLVPSSVECVA